MLSDRIRPNIEAAPWVVQEVKLMEAYIKQLEEDLCMTLRDYFAAAVLQGNLIEPTAHNDDVAKWAYSLADAMLKAREEGKWEQ